MSDYQRIKKAIDLEKQKKIQAEAKIETLKAEEKKLLDEIETLIQKRPSSSSDLQDIVNQLKTEIEADIKKLKDILDEEGVSY